MATIGSFLVLFALISPAEIAAADDPPPQLLEADVVIYDATPAGISAAIAAKRAGVSVLLISPHRHIGGLTTSGLGATDVGAGNAVGGIGREFYQALRSYYDDDASWDRQDRDSFKGRGHRRGDDVAWTFEPHVAEALLEQMLVDNDVRVIRSAPIDRSAALKTRSIPWRLIGLKLKDGRSVRGGIFIDASYEGDLLPAAGVPFTTGRESNTTHDETLNGVQLGLAIHHQFATPVSALIDPADPAAGLLPGILPEPQPADGTGDQGLQAYCFRMCLTDDRENQLPWTAPEGYDPARYELLLRTFDGGADQVPWNIVHMPNRKSDVNNNGAVSTDYIGGNHGYIEASDEERQRIIAEHLHWQQGLIWTLATHPRVPRSVQVTTQQWRRAADEFTDNDGWPWRIYVREGRRMVSTMVMNENHVRGKRKVGDPVGLASYGMDSHHVHRRAVDGFVRNEGDVQVGVFSPWPISYRSITPPPRSCSNLLVPVAISATHISYGSARMEPVFFVLGESAGIAAALAIREKTSVQQLPYPLLKKHLLKARQVLSRKITADGTGQNEGIDPTTLEGTIVDELDEGVRLSSHWDISNSVKGFVGLCYHVSSERSTARYPLGELSAGKWKVRLRSSPHENRCPRVAVQVSALKRHNLLSWKIIDQRVQGDGDGWHDVSEFTLEKPSTVLVSLYRISPQGYMVSDAVQLLSISD